MIIFFDIETINESKPEDSEKYGEKFNFMPEFNQIFCIVCWTITKEWVAVKNLAWNEEEQIRAFFKAIEWNQISWFNIKNFDIPFIIKRALKYWIMIPNDLKMFGKKPWEMENIIDLKDVYNYGVFGNFWNLDLICNFLWIKSPKDEWIDWSMVQEYFDKWRGDEIIDYCKRDVRATIELYEFFKSYNLM